MSEEKVIFEKIDENAKLPERQHPNDAGYDLYSSENLVLKVGEIKTVGTGLRAKLPENIEGQIRPRSGLSLSGITVMNSPGTIDPGYRGEIKVIMGNLLGEDKKIKKGDRIAQIVFAPIRHPEITWGRLDETDRGDGGFGSTGVR